MYGFRMRRHETQKYRQAVYRDRSRRLFFSVCQIMDRKKLRRVAVAKEISFSDNRSGQQIRHHRVYTRIAFP